MVRSIVLQNEYVGHGMVSKHLHEFMNKTVFMQWYMKQILPNDRKGYKGGSYHLFLKTTRYLFWCFCPSNFQHHFCEFRCTYMLQWENTHKDEKSVF